MREFIGIITLICIILAGLALLVSSRQSRRDVYIIRDYEIVEDRDAQQRLEQFVEEQQRQSRREALPGNDVPVEQQR